MKHNAFGTQQVCAGRNSVTAGAEPGHSAVKISQIRVEALAEVRGLTRDHIKARLQNHLDSEIDAPRVSKASAKILGAKAIRPEYRGDRLWLLRFDLYVAVLIDDAAPFLVHVGEWGTRVQRDFLDCVRGEITSGQGSIKLRRLDSNRISSVTGVPEQFAERLRDGMEKLFGVAGTKSQRDVEILTTKR